MDENGKKQLSLTCKHGDLINIVKFSKVLAIKTSPKICHQNLGSLIQPHPLSVKDCLVTKTVEALGKKVDQAGGRIVGTVNAVCKATSKFLA